MVGPSNIGPYHFARFEAISKLFPDFVYGRIAAKEYYRPWVADNQVSQSYRVVELASIAVIDDFLAQENPRIIFIVGYHALPLLKVGYWAKRNNIPSVLQTDSTYDDRLRHWWKERLKSLIVKRCFDAAFVSGLKSALYVESLGIKENMIWRGVDVVDNNHFCRASRIWRPSGSEIQTFFLTVTRLSPEKNISSLLSAYELYREKGGKWVLVIVGTGPEEDTLKLSVPLRLAAYVYWYGWAGYEELPSLYHGADCLILPSISEPWGLVVNEAMAAGLPILISRKCGCIKELCKEGVNGYGFDPYDREELVDLMLRMSSGQIDTRAMGLASTEIISGYTPQTWAETVAKITQSLTEGKERYWQ
jgi:glycosyltransferase involved in cell wall biosynthesis